MVTSNGGSFFRYAAAGIARNVFTPEVLEFLHGPIALGHIRYPTVSDVPGKGNTQPIVGIYRGGNVALAHNGNLTNAEELRRELAATVTFETSMDSECILHLFCRGKTGDPTKDLIAALKRVRGSYSLVLLLPDRLIAARDPSGNRPLSIGRLGTATVLSSETVGIEGIRAEFVRDIEPGEVVTFVQGQEPQSEFMPDCGQSVAHCRFESIYLGHPASNLMGDEVASFRMKLGSKLEETCPALGADIVCPAPDSAVFIALGFAASGRSGQYLPAVLRSHYVGRTFIDGTQVLRDDNASTKFNVARELVKGKSIVLVDDSIVRLTTMPKLVRQLREARPREVHVRIGSPMVRHPCRYGINTPTHDELAANRMNLEEMRTVIGADSLEFLPLQALRELSPQPNRYCYACWDGNYPLRQ